MPPFMDTPLVAVKCQQCGGTFDTKRPNIAKFCSNACRYRAKPPADPEKKREWSRAMYQRTRSDAAKTERLRAGERERHRKLKRWINEYKLEQGCIDCGYRKQAVALDFDHTDGKTSNISTLKSIAAAMAEIERHSCVVRCANCHRVKSWQAETWKR